MGYPRRLTVDPVAPRFYHVVSRCVRRAFLCGEDRLTGRNFDHRRGWMESRLIDLSESFAVALYAWAVMSNHTHVVLRVEPRLPREWSDREVARRWVRLRQVPSRKGRNRGMEEARIQAIAADPERLALIRERLGSISWFMRFLNEAIARMANAEDDCTGRFWEGRFKCQALLDEKAVLACMVYVDLNPIRAGLCDQLGDSDFTTIQRRVNRLEAGRVDPEEQLAPMSGIASGTGVNVSVRGYLDLLHWTLQRTGVGKARPGSMPTSKALPDSIRGSPSWWLSSVLSIETTFGTAVGGAEALAAHARATDRQRLRGC
jgi:REP element-mobilizing transposase RayT